MKTNAAHLQIVNTKRPSVPPKSSNVRKPKAPSRKEVLEAMNPQDIPVVDQVWLAAQKENLPAVIVGFLLGGFVPLATYATAHSLGDQLFHNPLGFLVLGGLIFSCYTVVAWGKNAFSSLLKSIGFVLLVEGSMTFAPVQWVGLVALAFLVVINGIATGVNLALRRHRV